MSEVFDSIFNAFEKHFTGPDDMDVLDLREYVMGLIESTRTPAPAEVERLVDRINDELFCGALKGETKSRLLAALSNKGENLSGDVIVPVEELEQDLEQYITLGSTGCRTITEDVEFNRLHSKFLAALSNTTPYLSQDVNVPVEKLEAGKEYDMTVRVRIESDVAKMETKPCLWVVIDGDSRKLEAWLRHAKPTFRKVGE